MSIARPLPTKAPSAGARPAECIPTAAATASGHAGRLAGALATLLFVIVTAFVGYRTATRLNFAGQPYAPFWGLQDFRDAIYYPVVSLLDGNNPYDTAGYMRSYPVGNTFPLYLPLTLVLHLPFGALPYRVAEAAYFLFSAALTPLIAYLTLRFCNIKVTVGSVLGLASLILLTYPGYFSIFLGQYTATLALGTYSALYFSRRRVWLAALGVAISTLKPTCAVPLAVLMLARRDIRPLLLGLLIAGAISAAVAPLLAHNAGGFAPLLASLRENYMSFEIDQAVHPVTSTHRIDAFSFFSRLLGQHFGTAGELAILFGILGFSALVIWRLDRFRDETCRVLSASLICVAVLACTYHQTYDLLLLTLPLTAMAVAPWEPTGLVSPWLRWPLLTMLALPACNYLMSDTGLRLFATSRRTWLAVTSLNGGALLLAWGLCLALALTIRRPGTSDPRPECGRWSETSA